MKKIPILEQAHQKLSLQNIGCEVAIVALGSTALSQIQVNRMP